MKKKSKKLFVYGTLLQGEPRNTFLQDSTLLGSLEVPGGLYFTDMGYPVASFNEGPDNLIGGELWELSGESFAGKIKMLDEIEGTELGLFNRKLMRVNGHTFFTYEAGESLGKYLNDRYKIRSGAWRLHGSIARENPINFALAFEKYLAKSYGNFTNGGNLTSIHARGAVPILVTAPHACDHIRMNKTKSYEGFTGALAVIIHSLTGSHALYTHRASEIDANFYDDSPFKKKIARIVKQFGIRFVLDIHGTSTAKVGDVFPGVGFDQEFLLGSESTINKLGEASERFGIRLGSPKIFPASRQMTVTKFVARKLGVPGMQIEISKELRNPAKFPERFDRLVSFIVDFLSAVRNNTHLSRISSIGISGMTPFS